MSMNQPSLSPSSCFFLKAETKQQLKNTSYLLVFSTTAAQSNKLTWESGGILYRFWLLPFSFVDKQTVHMFIVVDVKAH